MAPRSTVSASSEIIPTATGFRRRLWSSLATYLMKPWGHLGEKILGTKSLASVVAYTNGYSRLEAQHVPALESQLEHRPLPAVHLSLSFHQNSFSLITGFSLAFDRQDGKAEQSSARAWYSSRYPSSCSRAQPAPCERRSLIPQRHPIWTSKSSLPQTERFMRPTCNGCRGYRRTTSSTIKPSADARAAPSAVAKAITVKGWPNADNNSHVNGTFCEDAQRRNLLGCHTLPQEDNARCGASLHNARSANGDRLTGLNVNRTKRSRELVELIEHGPNFKQVVARRCVCDKVNVCCL